MDQPTAVPTCYRHEGRETYISCQRCGRPICPDCMRDAAVGFHCPECIAEGARTVRQARTAYGGKRSANPALTSIVLVAINAAVWLLLTATGAVRSVWVDRLALLPFGRCDSVSSPGSYYPGVDSAQLCTSGADGRWASGVAEGAWWQLMTSAFSHVEIWHIGFNMLALWFLGPQLEMVLGRARFLVVYLGSALAGSAMVYWLATPSGYTLGASGAIFGLMGALLVVAFKVGGNVQQLLMWIGINFLITVVGRGFISWQGHLGGFLGGLALAAVLVYAPRTRRTAFQAAGAAAVLAVLAVALVTRTLVLT